LRLGRRAMTKLDDVGGLEGIKGRLKALLAATSPNAVDVFIFREEAPSDIAALIEEVELLRKGIREIANMAYGSDMSVGEYDRLVEYAKTIGVDCDEGAS